MKYDNNAIKGYIISNVNNDLELYVLILPYISNMIEGLIININNIIKIYNNIVNNNIGYTL